MTLDQKLDIADAFLEDFKELVHKHAGQKFEAADPELLVFLQDRTSVYQPFIWS